jgi:hypothetical protein
MIFIDDRVTIISGYYKGCSGIVIKEELYYLHVQINIPATVSVYVQKNEVVCQDNNEVTVFSHIHTHYDYCREQASFLLKQWAIELVAPLGRADLHTYNEKLERFIRRHVTNFRRILTNIFLNEGRHEREEKDEACLFQIARLLFQMSKSPQSPCLQFCLQSHLSNWSRVVEFSLRRCYEDMQQPGFPFLDSQVFYFTTK